MIEEYLHPNNDHLLCELDPRHISLKHHARIQPPNRKNDNTKHSSSSEHTNITLRQQKASVSIVPSLLPKLPIDKADVYSRLRSQLLYPRNLRGMARVYDVERRLESDMVSWKDIGPLNYFQNERLKSILSSSVSPYRLQNLMAWLIYKKRQ